MREDITTVLPNYLDSAFIQELKTGLMPLDNVYFVSDFFIEEYQGGAEMVDDTIIKCFGFKRIKSINLNVVDPRAFYIISNSVQLPAHSKFMLQSLNNYIIFEHDYKIHPSRRPDLFEFNIVPREQRTNYSFYENARAVFLQSEDHRQCFADNDVKGNFVDTYHTSIWSKEELSLLRYLRETAKPKNQIAVIDSPLEAKGTKTSLEYAKTLRTPIVLIPKLPKREFYLQMSSCSSLVYMPSVKESFCRVVVEAKLLGMTSVLVNSRVASAKESWFNRFTPEKMELYLMKGTEAILERIAECLKV